MASLSQGRFSLPDPNVAIAKVTAGVDTSTASAIKAFGELGGDALKGAREGQLLNQLQESANIIGTLNQGYPAIQEAIESGNINPDTDKFYRLSLAAQQGKISQQRAAIEAEVVLRESIAKHPGWADHFRQTARETLGFDPSSAALNQLFLSGPDASKTLPLTQEQKDMEQATAMFNGGAVTSVEQGFQLIQTERAAQLREGITARQIQGGNLNAGKVAVEGANRASQRFNTVMLGAFSQIETQGGIGDIESFKGAIMSSADAVKSKIENEMAQSEEYAYTPEHYNQVRQRIDEQRDAYVQILDNQDLTKVLHRNRDRLANLVEIAGVSLAPDLAILRDLGEPAQQAYMDLMVLSGGDPKIMKELMASDPRKAFVGNLILQTRDIAPSLKAVADGNLGSLVAEGRLDKETARAVSVDQANAVVEGKPTAASIGKIFESLKTTEMPKTALDMVAKTAQRSYQEMTTDERVSVVDSFTVGSRAQMTSIHQALSNSPIQGLRLGWDGSKFVINDALGRPANEVLFFAPSQFASPEAQAQYLQSVLPGETGTKDALNYLNESLAPIVSNPNWQREMGFENQADWVSQVINRVNFQQMGTEVAQGGPILETLPPQKLGEFRQAWQDGNIQGVMEILGGLPQAGIGQTVGVAGEVSGVVDRSQPATPALTFPAYQGNTVPKGMTGAAALIYDFEGGIHDVNSDTWDGHTVAIGRDLKVAPLSAAERKTLGIPAELKTNKEIGQWFQDNPAKSEQLFQADLPKYEAIAAKYPGYDKLNDVQRAAAVNLAYNMGDLKKAGFVELPKALEEGDYPKAAKELLFKFDKDGKNLGVTKYVKDVKGTRAAATALMLRTGKVPSEAAVKALAQELENALKTS